MAYQPQLIIEVPRGGAVERWLREHPPAAVARGEAIVEVGPTDTEGNLEPLGGEVVLSVPSPEALVREKEEIRSVISRAGTGVEPLVLVVEAAEELREDELAPVLDAASRASRPVLLRVIRNA